MTRSDTRKSHDPLRNPCADGEGGRIAVVYGGCRRAPLITVEGYRNTVRRVKQVSRR